MKYLFTVVLFWASLHILFSQPKPCTKPETMTSFCADACVVCDINGFTGRNNSNVTGQAPPGFCTNQVHHMQWIAFIAGSTNLTLSLKVFGCQLGEGLEVGIYESLDCKTFKLVSNCDTDIPNNTTQNFTNTTPLVVGQYYYWVMDGSQNDICNYTISVVKGTTKVGELPNSGNISGETVACSGTSTPYKVQLPPGASRFVWTLNGNTIANSQDTTVNIIWQTPGNYNLCVTASNACDTAAPSCKNILVKKIPDTKLIGTICEGECYNYPDSMLCKAGNYQFLYKGSDGCDSLVEVQLDLISSVVTNLDLRICKGDSVVIGQKTFLESGNFQELLQTTQACDSTINLKLEVIECEIKGGTKTTEALCYGSSTGSLIFSVQNGTPPFKYAWTELGNPKNSGTGSILALNSSETISSLSAGSYYITVFDNFGNDVVLSGIVTEPPPLELSSILSDYNGLNISCAGKKDGYIQLKVSGGKPNYTYNWNDGNTVAQRNDLAAGIYTCTISDQASCTKVLSTTISEPKPLSFSIQFEQPGCSGINTGKASINATNGGTLPYLYDFQGLGLSTQTNFQNLAPGNYSIIVQDANGCSASQTANLKTPIIPEITLGPNLTVELGETVRINLTQNVALDSFLWNNEPGLSCYRCAEPEAQALRSTDYILKVTASGGCTDIDTLRITVKDRRNIYFPNIFSPDDDGENDHFTGFGGPEVLSIKVLKIFSRWGELVYEGHDITPGVISSGWDGRFKGSDASSGVFTWVSQVEFIDGLISGYEGTVTLKR